MDLITPPDDCHVNYTLSFSLQVRFINRTGCIFRCILFYLINEILVLFFGIHVFTFLEVGTCFSPTIVAFKQFVINQLKSLSC